MTASEPETRGIYKAYQSAEIQILLNNSALYQNNTWTPIKNAAKKSTFNEDGLRVAIQKTIGAILEHFHTDSPNSRQVRDTHTAATMTPCKDSICYPKVREDGQDTAISVKTSPDLSIVWLGPDISADGPLPRCEACLAPVEIRRHQELNRKEAMDQLGVYAKELFIQQPHRRYVPSVVITEEVIILFVIDRSGTIYSQPIHLHEDAETFVRIIVGISSFDSTLFSPFDHRVRWTKNSQLNAEPPLPVIKILETKSQEDLSGIVEYQATECSFQRSSVLGRGTVCWKAETTSASCRVKVFIKDCWRPANSPGEWQFCANIKDLKGVGQILAYDRESKISQFRNFIFDGLYNEENPYQDDRIFSRLVLRQYGPSIRYFKSKMQLLEAFRDAVAGHKSLWLQGILHRDISMDNILLGEDDAEQGNRGILIDFDMAADVTTELPEPSRFRAGTRAFQSVSVLKFLGYWRNRAPPQDHLDDLESYFYVLAWMSQKYDGPNTRLLSTYPEDWEDDDAGICAVTKTIFLRGPNGKLAPYFQTEVFKTLLKELGALCSTWLEMKIDHINEEKEFPTVHQLFEADRLKGTSLAHNKFLAVVDKAIREQQEADEKERHHNEQVAQASDPPPTDHLCEETSRPGPVTRKRRCVAPHSASQDPTVVRTKRLKRVGGQDIATAHSAPRRSSRLAKRNEVVKM